jgi:hypothetical protein
VPAADEVELDGSLDEAVDAQPVVDEVAVEERLVLVGVGALAVVPEIRRDVCLCVLARFGIELLEEVLERPDDPLPDALHDPRMAQRQRRSGGPAGDDDRDRGEKELEPEPAVIVASRRCG